MSVRIVAEKSSGNWNAKLNFESHNDIQPYFVTIENTKTGFIDYPVEYKTHEVAYDFPKMIPEYAKNIVLDLFWMRKVLINELKINN